MKLKYLINYSNHLFCNFYFFKFFLLMNIFNVNNLYFMDLNEKREGRVDVEGGKGEGDER